MDLYDHIRHRALQWQRILRTCALHRRGSTHDAIPPGPGGDASQHKFAAFLGGPIQFQNCLNASPDLAKSGMLYGDSSSGPRTKVGTDVSAALLNLNIDASGFEFSLEPSAEARR